MFHFVLQNVRQNLDVDGKQPKGGADGKIRRGAAFPQSGQGPRRSVAQGLSGAMMSQALGTGPALCYFCAHVAHTEVMEPEDPGGRVSPGRSQSSVEDEDHTIVSRKATPWAHAVLTIGQFNPAGKMH